MKCLFTARDIMEWNLLNRAGEAREYEKWNDRMINKLSWFISTLSRSICFLCAIRLFHCYWNLPALWNKRRHCKWKFLRKRICCLSIIRKSFEENGVSVFLQRKRQFLSYWNRINECQPVITSLFLSKADTLTWMLLLLSRMMDKSSALEQVVSI